VHPNGDTTSIPGHVNLAWKKNFLWEGGLGSIESVCMGDFEPEFFNTNMNDLVTRLSTHPSYPSLFKEAFNVNDISSLTHQQLKEYIVKAAAQFVNTLVSSNSRYDQFLRHEIIMTPDEQRGYIIFNTEEGDCFHCHGSVLGTDNKWHNNGLEENPTGQESGYYNFSHDTNDIGKFIAPTLRNIEYTAPYMHNAKFQTLEEVIEFYNSGVHLNSPNIDPIMTKPFKQNGLHLNAYDKACLVQFLKMFSDSGFIHNAEYSSPF
jgi:cytochrome c peroxidase